MVLTLQPIMYKTLQLRAAARYSGRGMLDLVLQYMYRLQDFEYKHIEIQLRWLLVLNNNRILGRP